MAFLSFSSSHSEFFFYFLIYILCRCLIFLNILICILIILLGTCYLFKKFEEFLFQCFFLYSVTLLFIRVRWLGIILKILHHIVVRLIFYMTMNCMLWFFCIVISILWLFLFTKITKYFRFLRIIISLRNRLFQNFTSALLFFIEKTR